VAGLGLSVGVYLGGLLRSYPLPRSTVENQLAAEARAGIFQDSGCWDTLVLVSFDRSVRLVCYSLGGWVLSHGLAERAGNKVVREIQVWVQYAPTRPLVGVFLLLRTLAFSLGLLAGLWLVLSLVSSVCW
jgi:hypothetical protein